MRKLKYLFAIIMTFIMLCLSSVTAFASKGSNLKEGVYNIKTQLSCYVNAMGGVEFGAPLLKSSQLKVSADGSKTLTLFFTKSNVTIYSITCDTFIDASPSYVTENNGVASGTIGYYDSKGKLVTKGVSYTLSKDTAENSQKEQVHYVDSITFPVTNESDVYNLTLYVNSNVMGTQFTLDGYPAKLTVDWSSVSSGENKNETGVVQKPSSEEKTENQEQTNNEQQTENESPDAHNMNGLNIYNADTEEEPSEEVAPSYMAFFNTPVLVAVGAVAVLLVAAGVVLLIFGGKEKTS